MRLGRVLAPCFPAQPGALTAEEAAAHVAEARRMALDRTYVHRRWKWPRTPVYALVTQIRDEVGPEWFAEYAPQYMRAIWDGGLYYHWQARLRKGVAAAGPEDPET